MVDLRLYFQVGLEKSYIYNKFTTFFAPSVTPDSLSYSRAVITPQTQ